jgi:hypothetical protein
MQKLIIEAVVVGIMTLVATNFIDTKSQIQVFLMGVFIHLFCEYTGINRYYCENGNACLRKK